MGMFDTIFINNNMLPISDEEKKLIGENPNWQTKDLDCDLSEIYITDNGQLTINRWELECVPKEERPYPDADGLRGLIGSMRRVNERLEVIYHHGYIKFYSSVGGKWYQFLAKFTDGRLESITGGQENN